MEVLIRSKTRTLILFFLSVWFRHQIADGCDVGISLRPAQVKRGGLMGATGEVRDPPDLRAADACA